MDFTDAEHADAGRDAMALLRAAALGRQGDVDAILEGAAERPVVTLCTARILAGMAADFFIRLTVTSSVAPDAELLEAATQASTDDLMAQPQIRAEVEANLAAVQAVVIEDAGELEDDG